MNCAICGKELQCLESPETAVPSKPKESTSVSIETLEQLIAEMRDEAKMDAQDANWSAAAVTEHWIEKLEALTRQETEK